MKLPPTLAASIDRVARKAIGKDWNLYASLIGHWREIVGEEYAQNTSPAKIVFPKGKKANQKWASQQASGGSLTIRLPQGLTMEFNFISEQIKSRINDFFGYPAIDRIILEPHYDAPKKVKPPKPPLSDSDKKALEKNIRTVENSELRDALQNLGESVLISDQKD